MKCSKCGGKMIVAGTLQHDCSVIRRRKCTECHLIAYTEEAVDPKKQDDIRYLFNKIHELKKKGVRV